MAILETKKTVGIIGGGIIGCSIAYHLRLHSEVTAFLIEKSQIGSGITARSAGTVCLLDDSIPEKLFDLRVLALKEYIGLEKNSTGSTGFHQTGSLVISDSRDRLDAIRRAVELSQQRSLSAEFLDSADKIKRIVPALNEAGIAGGGYTPEDGYFDPTAIAVTYASEASMRGARILTGTKATRILRTGKRVSGVETTNGNFNFDLVINAAGAWAHKINQMVPLDLPLWHSKGNVFILRPSARLEYNLPILSCPTFYVRPEGSRFFACAHPPSANESMGAEIILDPDALPLPGGTESHALEFMANEITQKIPVLANSSVVNDWLAYRMETKDGLPIVGESPVPGFMLAVGLGHSGVMLAPAVGMALAESIAAGSRSTLNNPILADLLAEFEVGRLCRENGFISLT